MLSWIEDFYVGDSLESPWRIKEKIDSGALLPGVYLLTLSENPHNLLEILPALSLKQPRQRELCPLVVGIARGKEEAMELAGQIIREVYKSTGSFSVEDYLKNR